MGMKLPLRPEDGAIINTASPGGSGCVVVCVGGDVVVCTAVVVGTRMAGTGTLNLRRIWLGSCTVPLASQASHRST